ncbi:MAG: hypothetical protein A2W34_06990 [Chloroflexi bacterium RBG_16_64_32]|nr:MAG: hypothetical protein A2W34_06990 [Chloroflexi bacterium RBG_16_64_32]
MDGLNALAPGVLAACEAAGFFGAVTFTFEAGQIKEIDTGQRMRTGDQVQLFMRRLLGARPQEKPP